MEKLLYKYLVAFFMLWPSILWSQINTAADTTSSLLLPVGYDTTQYGYPETRPVERIGGPEDDLARSFPMEGAVFKKITVPRLAIWKTGLYKKTGIKLALSYQVAFLYASEVINSPNHAAGGFFLPEIEWDIFNRGKDFQGGLVVSFLDVHSYGNAAAPAFFFQNTGSLTAHDPFYVNNVDFSVGNLFWEQWFKKDRFVVRVGNISVPALIDFFRYADFRTSFHKANISFPVQAMPYGPPGMGISFKWWPIKDSELYVTAIANDINSEIENLNFTNIFNVGDIFFGSEIGYNWKRLGAKGGELDHIHLNIFYADVPSEKQFAPVASAGWGFKIAGEKQHGNWVGFANWAYNSSKGGGFGLTALQHSVNLGIAYNNPWRIKGEIAVAYLWSKAFDDGRCGALPCTGQQQSDIEIYWKILVLPDLWVTPGVQMAFSPSLIDGVQTPGLLWVPSLRSRLFF